MSTLTKVFIVLTAIFSITSSVLFIGYAAQTDNWKRVAEGYRTRSEAEFLGRQSMQATMEASIAMKDDQISKLTEQLGKAQIDAQKSADDNAKLKSEVARKTNEAAQFEAGRSKLQEILDVQTAQLRSAQEQNQTLLTQNIDLQTRNTRLNSRVLELTARTTILTDEARNLQEKLYAAERMAGGTKPGAAAETPAGAVAAQPAVRGPISAEVTDVQDNYVSINAGESSGVQKGMTFLLSRNGSYVGDLVIDRVRPNEAGGKVQSTKGGVQRGDRAAAGLN